jgi:hypothetical protein
MLVAQSFAACLASAGRVRVGFYRLPFRACADGCADRRVPHEGFVEALRAAVLQGGQLPTATQSASGGPAHCHRCMSRQWRSGVAAGSVEATLSFPELPAFDVDVHGPLQTCASCGLSQLVLDAEVQDDLRRALDVALEAAGIRTRFR